MTDAAKDVFDSPVDDLENTVAESESTTTDNEPDKSAPRGYMSKEAWVEAGKDPALWVSPEVFAERGERFKMKQQMERDFDNRIRNLSLLHQAQLKTMREDLLAKRDDAIESADKAAVKGYDKQLKELDDMESLVAEKPANDAPQKNAEILEWESENPWVNDPSDARTPIAQHAFQKAMSEGKTVAGALRAAEKAISAAFSDTSKKPAQIAESSRSSASEGKNKVTMSSLTAEEKKVWETGMFSSQEKFLKAVEDDRKARKS